MLMTVGFFLFLYPLFMSLFWIIGGTMFYFRREAGDSAAPELKETPFVSILVPCYNEDEQIEEMLEGLMVLNYPDYEVIAINDGSTDSTKEILVDCSRKFDRLRVVNSKENKGKANALYLGVLASNGEIVLTLDSDACLDKDALQYLIPHFTTPNYSERVGAVTGNPRIRNRSSLLARIQFIEYCSIIGLIKRSQRIIGKVMTVSGVVAAFRKKALLDIGFWDKDIIADDIGVTWKLQKKFWDVRYEPRALCWMLVPETVRGLWKQRIRWAQGGVEALLRHYKIFTDYKQRRLFAVYIEQVISIIWSIIWILYLCFVLIFEFDLTLLLYGTYLAIIALVQLTVSLLIDKKYEKTNLKYILWASWYPLLYWFLNVLVLIPAIPRACKILSKNRSEFATWESPDRGLRK